jgi:hypothetical protein
MRAKLIFGDFSQVGAFIYFTEGGGSGRVFSSKKAARNRNKRALNALQNGIDLGKIDFTRPFVGSFYIREDHPAFNIDVLGDIKYFSNSALADRIEMPLAKSVMLSIKQD